MAEDVNELLRAAVSRNAAAVLSLRAGGALRHRKSRFLADVGGAFWVQSVPDEHEAIDRAISGGALSGVSFKGGQLRVVFAAPILQRDSDFRVNTTAEPIEALLLKWPGEMQVLQRRGSYRARIGLDSELIARVWRIGEKTNLHEKPLAGQEIPVQLRDISVGGIGVTLFGRENDPPRVSVNDRLRVQLTLRKVCLLLDGRVRYPDPPPRDGRAVHAGIQFSQMAEDLGGRQTMAALAKIVGEMQRAEARRVRLGLMSTPPIPGGGPGR